MKIFLSPSNETKNIGCYKTYNTNECEQAEKIAEAAKTYLADYECEVMIGKRADTMQTRIAKAKEWGEQVHVPIHTNACSSSTVWGTETFYHSEDKQGKKLATALLNELGSLIGKKRSAKARDNLIETNTPCCTRAYIECDFHTNPERAKWIVNHTKDIGECIAKTLIEFYSIAKKGQQLYDIRINGLTEEQVKLLQTQYPSVELLNSDACESGEIGQDLSPATSFNVGDAIMLDEKATVYGSNTAFKSYIYKRKLFLRELKGDRAVISTLPIGPVTGAVDVKYIRKYEV